MAFKVLVKFIHPVRISATVVIVELHITDAGKSNMAA